MKQWIAAGVIAGLMAGCSSWETPMDDGYDFGDLSRTALQLRANYCLAVEDSKARAAAGNVLRSRGIPVPEDGICNEVLDRLGD